ncbi:MAG: 30S ribosomal protein S12 methylthiotransferase RimO [Kyrpidia tusciae]|nr:30S ribosomal protein S12 methylthiotransferase RimO [Kyrpidia tusciae]MBE3553124.1 30S ribosomal protein S12 methylthiotransferase RimO [Kyrpidia tusciae]
MGRQIAVVTLGCEKNQVDSEVMMGLMERWGFDLVADPQEADVIVVNTCGFVDQAKAESVNTILQMAQYKENGHCKALVVAGCLAQRYQEELMREIPEIDGMLGTGEFHRVPEVVEQALAGRHPMRFGNPVYLYDEVTPRKRVGLPYSSYVKIAEGCDHGCTFCAIPLMRGKFRSRPIPSIVEEARRLAADGVREISLIAQDSTQYGLDLYGRRRLPDLLKALNDVDELRWIRLHYAYPGYFTDELIDAMAGLPKVCKYVDLPLQHSEDEVLRAMHRPGRNSQVRKLLERIRTRIPNVAIRSSFIVGFPGETEEQFLRLADFVEEMAFDRIGVFAFSREEGTPSAAMEGQISEAEKERRAAWLMEVGRKASAARGAARVGQVIDCLLERQDDRRPDIWIGRSEYDAPEIDGQVFVSGAGGRPGEFVKVRITHSFDFDLAGEGA